MATWPITGKDSQPKLIFHNTYSTSSKKPKSKQLYLGVELEFEYPKDCITYAMKEFILKQVDQSWLYSKYDWSVNNGMELITHPFTYQWYKKNKDSMSYVLDVLQTYGIKSGTSAAIHVHMNKSAFTEKQLYNFQKLIYNNPEFTKKLSNRTWSNLSNWASIDNETAKDLKYKSKYKYMPDDAIDRMRDKISSNSNRIICPDKYVAVNVMHDDTIEVRIFRSSTNHTSFFKCIEFCKAAYDYSCNVEIVTLKGFFVWCKNHKEDYPHLFTFLKRHKYVSA